MKKYAMGFLRIAYFIERPTKLTREWFNGTMLYTRHNPKWFVRLFELGNGITESLLDFGTIRPDGIIACGVPALFLQRFFRERGMGDVPIMAFPQNPYPGIGTVRFDSEQSAARAIDLFKRRGCRHVVFVRAASTSATSPSTLASRSEPCSSALRSRPSPERSWRRFSASSSPRSANC